MNSSILHMGQNQVDMSLVIGRDHLSYQERVKLTGVTSEKKWDAFEKAKEQIETCGFYPNYQVVKGMPQSVFADQYGYDMQNDIYHCMTDFYAGKISESDVKDYLEECCVSMRIYRTQQCQTSGHNVENNQQIVGQVYEIFAKMNARAARHANYEEGLAENQAYGGRSDDWVYYNSDYYYKCEETKELLQRAALYVTDQWEIPAIDTKEIEKNTGYTIDGGLDFNSGWNWQYRNQRGIGSMEDESVAPPKDFKLFYKLDDTFKAEHKKDSQFLSALTVFMRWYAYASGINNISGNHVPRFE